MLMDGVTEGKASYGILNILRGRFLDADYFEECVTFWISVYMLPVVEARCSLFLEFSMNGYQQALRPLKGSGLPSIPIYTYNLSSNSMFVSGWRVAFQL
jgi:hypothetical protein